MKRIKALIVMMLVAILSAVVVDPIPAQAGATWQTYTVNKDWSCSAAVTVMSNVYQKSCIVANAYGDALAVVAVSNYRGVSVRVHGGPTLYVSGADGFWDVVNIHTCLDANILPGTTRACLGPTTHLPGKAIYSLGEVQYNGDTTWKWTSSPIGYVYP
ncbi:hypothetical protein [Micromonospora maritima]|uniref:hypothetical protein n=1 Tax=Micromonospora maritima TaxID=986711 RepID=UPI0037B0AE6C